MGAMSLTVHTHFDAAHYLPHHPGKCARLHGHRWEVVVTVNPWGPARDAMSDDGMLVDFGLIKDKIATLDHQNLNEELYNPTAENLAILITSMVEEVLPRIPGVHWSIEVQLQESPGCMITYRRSI